MKLDLRLSDQVVNLFEEGVEIAFRIGELHLGDSSSFIARSLRPYRMVACSSPAYLETAGEPKTPADLAAHQCIGFTFWNRKLFNEWVFTQSGTHFPVRVDCKLQVNSGHAQRRAALHDAGILLAAEDLVREDLESGCLVRVLPEFDGPSRPLSLIYAAQRQHTAKVRRFVDEAVGAFSRAAMG